MAGNRVRKINDLGNDRMFPLILRLVIPSMLAQLVNVLYSIVDRIFISRTLFLNNYLNFLNLSYNLYFILPSFRFIESI